MAGRVGALKVAPRADTSTAMVQASFEDLGTPLFDVPFVVIDLETTGLSPERDRITEIGAVKVRGGEVIGELQCLVHPGSAIPAAVSTLTGITDHMVRDRPPIESVLPALIEFVAGTTLVAHNAHFDLGFLQAACSRHGYPRLAHPVIDTARLARRVLGRDEVRDVRLSTLAAYLRATVRPEHRALADARATVDVLHALLERAGSLGVATLEDLRDYTRSTSDPSFRRIGMVDGAPDAPGVYRFLDEGGHVLYVGKATSLRQRLRTYFGQDPRRKIADLVRETSRVTWEVAPTPLEAHVREIRTIHRHRPRFNRRSRSPERGVYVKLTRERFPRLSIVTAIRDEQTVHVGPMSRRAAESFVEAVHEALPLRQCTDRITAGRGRAPCLLKDLGRCGAPCDGTQSVEEYAPVAASYVRAVTDDPSALLQALRDLMHERSVRARYERAQELRARLHLLSGVLSERRRVEAVVAAGCVAAVRSDAGACELVIVNAGRLVASEALPPDVSEDRIVSTAQRLALLAGEVAPGPPPREDHEEIMLTLAWLEQPGVRLLSCSGRWDEPLAGGALVERTRLEARAVARAVRRDAQRMRGEKVVRRNA